MNERMSESETKTEITQDNFSEKEVTGHGLQYDENTVMMGITESNNWE